MSRWIRSSGRFFLFVPLFLALAPSAAFAACASPTGTAGQIIYNADHAMPQYCDGTNWIGFGGASGGSSPVAYWKLDETSGTTVADSAGGYTGTWQFAATNDPVTGVIGNAAQTGWARTIHTAGPITEIGGASQATLSLWMRRGAAGYGEQVGQGIGFESQEFSIAYAGSDVVFTIPDTVVDGTWAQGAYALNDTQWHMLTLVFDGTQTGDANRLKGYVDGQSVTLTYTGTIGTTIGGTAFDFVIATEGDSDVSYIDDVRVYNRALSATEVSGLYNAAIRGAGPTPIAHWKLDETSGTTAEDSIGTNDGTLTNGPVWQPSGGQIGGAVSVDGTNDYVDISATGFPANNASQTLSAWFKYSATLTNNAALVSLSNSSNSVVSMGFECCVGWLSVTSFGGAQLVTYNSAPSANVWHHMVYTFNGTNHVLYLDGVQVGTSTTAPNTGTPSGVYVGQNGFSNRYFPGLIDDVKIYDRALTAAEVAALYDVTDCHAPAGEAGTILFNADHSVLQYCNGVDWVAVDAGPSTTASYNTTGLAAHWKLDEGSGTTAADSSGNNNTGTLTNGPTWTTGKLAGAVNFDGTDDQININHSASLDTSSAYTLAGWVRFDSATSGHDIIYSKNNIGGWGSRLTISRTSAGGDVVDGKVRMAASHNENEVYTAWSFPYQQWFYLTVTWDGATIRFYADAAMLWEEAFAFAPTVNTGTAHLGYGVWNWGDTWFDGAMDDMRLWNRALSANEIAALYSNTSPPVGMWLFDDGTGTTATDSAGSNDGTLTNGPVWQSSGGHDGGGAVQFDGTNDYINLGSPASLDDLASFTYSAWIYPYTLGEGMLKGVIVVKSNGSGTKLFSLNDSVGNNLYGYVETTASAATVTTGLNTVTLNEWQHVAMTYNDTTKTVTIYKNGVSIGSGTGSGSLVSEASGDMIFGNLSDTSRTFDGLIDDVRIWDRALSAGEVADLYNASAPAMPTPMAMWKFDEGSGTTAADSIGGNDGTLTNGPTWGTGMFGGAVDFPTSNDVVTLPSGLAAGKTQMSVTAWVNSRSIISTSFQPIYIESNAGNCGDSIFQLYFWDGNNGIPGTELRLKVDGTEVASSGETVLSNNTWYFVAGVFDSITDQHAVYINGIAYTNSSAQSAISTTAVDAAIGNNSGGLGFCTNVPFNGLIDNVQVYDTALTAAQIRSLYRASACSDPTGAAGTMLYNTTQSKLQYCNGTNWVGVGK